MGTLIGLRNQEWSAGDMRHLNTKKMHRHPVSSMGVLFKVSKITTKFFDLFKVRKNAKKQPSYEAAIQEAAIQRAAIPDRYYRMIKIN